MIDLTEVEKEFKGFYRAVGISGMLTVARNIANMTKGAATLSSNQIIAWGLVVKYFAKTVTANTAWETATDELNLWLSR